MEKHELIGLTLDRLIDHFMVSPESFDYADKDTKPASLDPTICWQPKIELPGHNVAVNDPNNTHGVIVVFNESIDEMICYVFLKAPTNLMTSGCSGADSIMTSRRHFEKWRANYRKFTKLKKLILARSKHRESMDCLKKLSSVFPDAMDKHLL